MTDLLQREANPRCGTVGPGWPGRFPSARREDRRRSPEHRWERPGQDPRPAACLRRGTASRVVAAAIALLLTAWAPAFAQGSHVLVIVGLGGDHENAERFHRWASAIVDAAKDRYALPPDSIVYLGEDPARDKARISGRSTRDAVDAAVTRLAAQARPGDRVFIVLIGHGASATGEARFNLPGPDLAAPDFARLAARFAAQQVVLVNTASASGGFVAALSGKDRTVITATRTEGERNQTRFGEFFADALSTGDADMDKDGRVSMLEAFAWTRLRVAESYERDGQLLTEHAMLDDDGDGKGTAEPGQPGADGAVARTLFLSAGAGQSVPGADTDPATRALVEQRQALEDSIAALKASKEKTDPAAYASELERLLIDLARTSAAIKEKVKR